MDKITNSNEVPKIATITNFSEVTKVSYHPDFSAFCSIGEAPFFGTIEITYYPVKRLLEFESFERWLFDLSNKRMTIEDLARLVFDELTDALGDIPLSVTVNARTTVHARASATVERSFEYEE